MPGNTAPRRVAAIEGEGAEVVRVDGDYDRAVEIVESIDRAGSILLQESGD